MTEMFTEIIKQEQLPRERESVFAQARNEGARLQSYKRDFILYIITLASVKTPRSSLDRPLSPICYGLNT